MKIITQNLLIFIFLLLFSQKCRCMINPHICNPSACGSIRNISSPFRLKNDPKHCGKLLYELECENSHTTVLYLNSRKYKVKEINYVDQTIWLADVSVNNNSICSFPDVSLTRNSLLGYPYDTETWNFNFTSQFTYSVDVAWPISYMRCPYPLKNSSFFTELPSRCASSNSSGRTYVKVGHMNASEVRENCTLYPSVLTSWKFKDLENISVSEIHDSLLYGFRLSILSGCRLCNGRFTCDPFGSDSVTCSQGLVGMLETLWDHIKTPNMSYDGPTAAAILVLLLIIGVSLPAKIIIGFICAYGFMAVEINNNYFNTEWHVKHLRVIIGIFFALRFVIVLPYMLWFLIYKYRRRHLSRYAIIEDFLQSDNNGLMPIRYSYSDIKKMTRGFREKLGQGGYGTVYKGKLRSGFDVAVKLLGKPGGNGQDFMSEIATIGRIHHVNVVNLIGYCAERSKRALVFDFMPNGSLDKYIFGRERINHLTWEKKYEIALGVARGIEYLHRGCDIQILHFDIKPHNILLDENFTPKISDFGLAKFYSTDKNMVTLTAIRGTIGYVAPELINRGFGRVSNKADVYSFGMLLMEMVGLNRDVKGSNQASSQYFPCWIYDCFDQGRDIDFGVVNEHNDDDNNDTNTKIAKKMTIVALWCIQMSPCDRPSMNKVVEMLEGRVERLHVPNRRSRPAQIAVTYDQDQSWTTYSTDSTSLPLLMLLPPSKLLLKIKKGDNQVNSTCYITNGLIFGNFFYNQINFQAGETTYGEVVESPNMNGLLTTHFHVSMMLH